MTSRGITGAVENFDWKATSPDVVSFPTRRSSDLTMRWIVRHLSPCCCDTIQRKYNSMGVRDGMSVSFARIVVKTGRYKVTRLWQETSCFCAQFKGVAETAGWMWGRLSEDDCCCVR